MTKLKLRVVLTNLTSSKYKAEIQTHTVWLYRFTDKTFLVFILKVNEKIIYFSTYPNSNIVQSIT